MSDDRVHVDDVRYLCDKLGLDADKFLADTLRMGQESEGVVVEIYRWHRCGGCSGHDEANIVAELSTDQLRPGRYRLTRIGDGA